MVTTLTAEQFSRFVEYFMAGADYFNGGASGGTELWEKVKPRTLHASTNHIAIKTFRTNNKGNPITEDLPFTLVPAEESFDMWSIGVSECHYEVLNPGQPL